VANRASHNLVWRIRILRQARHFSNVRLPHHVGQAAVAKG